MKYFLLDKLLQFIARRLDGYKTIVGGVGLILSGMVGLAGHMWPDQGLPQMDLDTALATLSAGFAVLGLGGKMEKLRIDRNVPGGEETPHHPV